MSRSRTGRKAVALVAAYAIALQVLFTAFSAAAPTAAAAAFHGVVCTVNATRADGRGVPLHSHDAACVSLCAMASGAQPQGDLSRPTAVAWLACAARRAPDYAVRIALPDLLAGSPHRSRAPPAA